MLMEELHGVPLMQSTTKWSRLVRDRERIPEYLSMASRHLTSNSRSSAPGFANGRRHLRASWPLVGA